MSPDAPAPPPPPPDATPQPTPGEVVRPAQRPLERPPSERYATKVGAAPPPSGSVLRAILGAAVPAAIGGGLLVLLASPLALSEPLVVVALLVGLGTGRGAHFGGGTLVGHRRRRTIGVWFAVAAVALAEVVVWRLAIGEGGVLSFAEYQWLAFGPIAVLQPVAAGLAAWAAA